jgi:hypothetical protein
VRYCHKLGKRQSAKEGVVCPFKIRDHEVDELCAEVVRCTKLNGECDLAERYRTLAW